MSRLTLKEYPISVGDREFLLREMNGRRSEQIDDLGDEATAIRARMAELDPSDLAGKKACRAEIRSCDARTYRILLIPVNPPEPPSDEWIQDNIGTGFLENEIVPHQTILNAHQDVLGKN